MNTSKQINIMVLLVFASVIATAAYTLWDPHRSSEAETRQTDKTVEYGAYLFAQNCIVCHGNKGEGGSASNRLKVAPPLNRNDLQGKDASGNVNKQTKAQQFKFVVNTITCGRIGKAMPTWGQSQGGPLNDQQIQQLATMITEGTGWDLVNEFAIEGLEKYHINGYAVDGFKLAAPLDASSTTVALNKVDGLDKGVRLEIDEPGPKDPVPELMLITDKPNVDAKTVQVERGLGTTSPAAHAEGSQVLKPPVPPDPPAITQPACGQNLPPAVPTSGVPVAAATSLTVVGQGTAFDTDKLLGVAGQPLTITFDNKDAGIVHNIHFFKGTDATGDDVGSTDLEAGPVVQTLNVGPLDAGEYFYHCDAHPGQMEGILTTVEGGGAPAAGAATPGAGATTPAPGATQAAQTPSAGGPSAGSGPTVAPTP